MLLICYPKCGTCRKAQKWLEDNGIGYDYRDIKTDNPSAEELAGWIRSSGLPARKFFNTSGMLYRDMQLKDKLPSTSKQVSVASFDKLPGEETAQAPAAPAEPSAPVAHEDDDM